MSAATSWRSALFLAILMAIIGPLQMTGNIAANSSEFSELAEHNTVNFSMQGAEEFIQLQGDGIVNNDFTVEVPSASPITDMQLSIEPSVMQTHYGFVWDSDAAWSNSDATKNGTVVERNVLTGSTAGTLWDFNNGLQGWTVSSSTFVSHWTNTCGVNGTSGGSIKTQANFNAPHHATSPTINLAGAPSMPLTAWVLQGSFNCGEEPDSGEDLQIQYIDTGGTWVTLNTWSGATSGGTVQQYSTNLPPAALHANTQIRINQISGSGSGATCCDFWFVDDVHLASPPESHWISPTIGWGQSATESVARNTYAPLFINANIPEGAYLNWSILDQFGNEIEGVSGSNDWMVPINLIDFETHPLIRIKLSFKHSELGLGIPELYSISGDGAKFFDFGSDFSYDSVFWNLNCSPNDDFLPCGSVTDFDIDVIGTSYLSSNNIALQSDNGTGLVVDYTANRAFFDQAETISPIISPGRLYSNANNVGTSGGTGTGLRVSTTATPIDSGKVELATITTVGSGYVNANSQVINSGPGTGLTIDYTTSSISKTGIVGAYNLQTSGAQYASGGSSVSITGGSGSGMLVDFTTNTYVPGITSSISINNDGTSYASSSSVQTTGGSGNGLTFDVIASDYNQVISLSEIDDGTNYSTGVTLTNCISCIGSGLVLDITSVGSFTGSIFGYDILVGGTGYSIGDIISINGGDGDARYQVSAINTIYPVSDLIEIDPGDNYTEQVYSTSCSQCSGNGLKIDVILVSVIDGKILSYDIDDGGSGYDIGDRVTVLGGDFNAIYEVNEIDGSGHITSLSINNPGQGYSSGDLVTIQGGDFNAIAEVVAVTHTGGDVTSISLVDGGQGYAQGDVVRIPGGSQRAKININSVYSIGGNITSFSIIDEGSNYNQNQIIPIPGGDSNGYLRVDSVKSIGGNVTSASIVFGGEAYSPTDILTINGGDGQATFEIQSIIDTGGNITSVTALSGTDYAIGDKFSVPGGKNDSRIEVSQISQTGFRGGLSCQLTTDWIYTLKPTMELIGTLDSYNTKVEFIANDDASWTQVSQNNVISITSDEIIYRYKLKISIDSVTDNYWSLSDIDWTELSGVSPTNPRIDYSSDGNLEWGGGNDNLGQWGWQDRFVGGNTTESVSFSGTKVVNIWIPRYQIQSFSFGITSSYGYVNDVFVKVGNSIVENYTMVNESLAFFQFNSTQIDNLRQVSSSQPSVGYLNTNFIEISIEMYGSGTHTISGLSAPYPTEVDLDFDRQSRFVLELNDFRSILQSQGGIHQIPIPISSETPGSLSVAVNGFNFSNDVELIDTSMSEDIDVLTTSQKWLSMESRFSITGSNLGVVRLDVEGEINSATWLIPSGGGSPIGQGDSHLIELHPNYPINVSYNGDVVDTLVTFRIKQSWDDENYLKISTRMVLSNGVISMPATHGWGSVGGTQKALENDMEIKSVTFSDTKGTLSSDEYYLMAGQSIDISVDVGFEDIVGIDSFYEGEGLVNFYSGNNVIANTTKLDEDVWNFSITVPFTNGIQDWRIELIPLDGSGVTVDANFTRQFFADSVAPRVIDMDIYSYDHRVPSSTQFIQVQITDQPVLPSNVEAMVWREWINDYDFNGLPSPDEYQSFSDVLLPNDMTSFVGQYTILLDDSGGSIGDKVAVYLTGNDPAGHPLEDNGTGEEGEHLFMYQLKADGPPSIPTAAFSWEGGRQTWLHPMIGYEFDVMMNEPNGGSDLMVVEVQLASQQNSDRLPISWDFITGECTTTSPHMVIDDCEMIGQNGPAGPYEEDLTLNVEFHLLWTIPDLGDTKREPKLIVQDRAGNTDQQAFPTLRWRSSGDMYIPDETIQLVIEQGTAVDDGARIAPGSSFEVSGDVLFRETNTRPDFDCPVSVNFDGITYPTIAIDGSWTAAVTASESSGKKALTWGVECISGQGDDVTDESNNRWILVDGTGPTPVEIINPRPNTILETEVYEVRVAINEEGGLDIDSLQLEWWVEDADTGDRLLNGYETMTLEGEDVSGPQIEVYASVDLSDVTDTMIQNKLILFVKINGRDLADNAILGMNGAPAGSEIAQWDLEWLRPEFAIGPLDVSYTRLILEVGQSTSVQALVSNTGSLDGTVDATAYVVKLNGTKEVLQRPSIEIPAGGKGLISIDWAPTTEGVQWIEVELDNDQTAKGPTVNVRPAREQGFIENLFGDVNPLIGSVVALIFISIIVTGLLWARKATRGRGSGSEYDWDDYSSEIDYDDYDDYDEESTPQSNESPTIEPAASVGAASAALVGGTEAAAEEETDWVMGADGYWWYHDKDTNEWWYKDENGEIVKFN